MGGQRQTGRSRDSKLTLEDGGWGNFEKGEI